MQGGSPPFQGAATVVDVSSRTRWPMRTNLSQAVQAFFNAETIVPFVIGSLVLAIFGNATYDILKNWLGTDTPNLVKIAVSALLILALAILFAWYAIDRRLRRLGRRSLQLNKRSPQQFRGLILLVSRAEPCRKAIHYHLPKLQHCWLLCSLQSLEIAQQIAADYPQVCSTPPIVINDIYDPLEFRNVISDIYQNSLPPSWTDQDVIADYVGMTAHGSVGLVLSCVGTNRALQYTPANIDPQTGKIDGSLDPIEITLT
jgi:hypothetical protein